MNFIFSFGVLVSGNNEMIKVIIIKRFTTIAIPSPFKRIRSRNVNFPKPMLWVWPISFCTPTRNNLMPVTIKSFNIPRIPVYYIHRRFRIYIFALTVIPGNNTLVNRIRSFISMNMAVKIYINVVLIK